MSLNLGTGEISPISMFASLGTTVDCDSYARREWRAAQTSVTGAGSRTRVVCIYLSVNLIEVTAARRRRQISTATLLAPTCCLDHDRSRQAWSR
jgi:hypothetical protein